MKKQTLVVLALLSAVGLAAAIDPLSISPDQPICRLYGMIQLFGTIVGVLVAAYSGFQLTSSSDNNERNNAKMMLSGVVVGLIIIWIAPLLVKNLVGAGNICGW